MTYAEDAAKRFKGELKHMKLKDENGKNQFVTAKQTTPPLVLAPYDTSPIKHMPVYKEKSDVWENAKIQYDPSKSTLTATTSQGRATITGDEAKRLMSTLLGGEQSKAKKNQLLKSVSVEGKGNAIKIKAFL